MVLRLIPEKVMVAAIMRKLQVVFYLLNILRMLLGQFAPIRNLWTMTQERDNGLIIKTNTNKHNIAADKLNRVIVKKALHLCKKAVMLDEKVPLFEDQRTCVKILPNFSSLEHHIQLSCQLWVIFVM